ncbi:glutamate receptor ionotropic, kainate 2-like [Vanessa tameamea]|uniref:Glutamate receptor ionotropic, kainate 2-like n=1 Tax=Vanessa tameamea TaxID=334116 RepID=A0ABM4ALW8_VANTA
MCYRFYRNCCFLLPHSLLPSAFFFLCSLCVVEARPEIAVKLVAAVNAVLRDHDGTLLEVPAPVEPQEPLAEPGQICLQAGQGATAVVGGSAGADAAARAGLALLLAEPAPENRHLSSALELYPHLDVLARACAALCEAKDWQNAVVLHEGSARVAPRLAPDIDALALRARQLPPPHDDNALRNLLLVLKKLGAINFIVWCDAECSVRVLDAAQRVGLLADRHSYVLTALDLHTLPLADYSYGGANITGLRIFNAESSKVSKAMGAWREEYVKQLGETGNEEEIANIVDNPPTAVLLTYDAATIVAKAMKYLDLPTDEPGSCEHGAASSHADTLLNYLRSEKWEGVSGPLVWEAGGERHEVLLQVTELERGGRLAPVASWAPHTGLAWLPRALTPSPPGGLMTNRTFAILIAMNKPYIMKKQSSDRLFGNDRYEGFCIELIDRLSKLLHFNYTFVEQMNGAYGVRNKTTNQWNGMMRRLMDDPDIQFAVTDLTITAEREEAVDFTTPFMNLGISILFRKPQQPEPALLAFLLPFSNGVWLCLGLAYLGTSLVLYVVGRLCPDEWQNPYPCVEEPPALENQFTLANALWFNLGAVLQQGSEIAPVAYGTRAVASCWWIFALVITSSYTANLATLLATKSSTELIKNVRDLAENDQGITYGAKAGGSTYTFFELSENELYQKMFQKMKEQEMPKSNEAGIQKVMTDKYAFFAESTTIEYTVERNCEVTSVGDLLDSKGYGIAMKKNSEYRQSLNLALLNLQEAGVLREMKYRWWKEMHGGGACQPSNDYESEELSLDNFMGLFLVLVVGCALGVVVSCCDLACSAWRHPRDPERSFLGSFWSELRFVFRFEQSVKPVRGPLSPAASPHASASASTPSARSGRSADGDEGAGGEAGPRRPRTASLRSGRASARRSSMHAASLRLARHATTPTPR